MSKVTIAGDVNGTGVFTIASPNGNTNRTLTLPDVTATVITDSAGILNIGSGQVYKDANGNVGIGTSSPTAKLAVDTTNSAEGIRVTVGQGSYSGYVALFGVTGISNGYYIHKDAVNNIQHIWDGTGGAERMRLDSAGNLLVGTTSNTIAGPGPGQLACLSTTAGKFALSLGNTAGSSAYGLGINSQTGENVYFYYQGAYKGAISTSAGGTTYSTSSDYRLKNTIEPMTGALDKVALLKPCTYKWIADGSDGQGFIAHELAEVEPGCVSGEKDAVDAEGKPKYQGIDTSFLVATLAAAIQELKAIVDAQGAEIASLKGASA